MTDSCMWVEEDGSLMCAVEHKEMISDHQSEKSEADHMPLDGATYTCIIII